MTLIQLQEQLSDGTYLPSEDAKAIVKITGGGANANNIFKNIQINLI